MVRDENSTMIRKASKKSQSSSREYCFEGTERRQNNCTFCDYCQKYLNESMYLDNLQYCINCWSVMDYENFDVEKLTYKSDTITIEKVIAFVSKYYEQYLEKGENAERDDCIFEKIRVAREEKKLHFLLERELNGGVVSYKNLDEYKLFIKNRNPKINFNVSAIDI